MLCDECGERPAVIRVVIVREGEKIERNLCIECMVRDKKMKLDFAQLAGQLRGLVEKASGAPENADTAPDNVPDDAGDADDEAADEYAALKCSRCGLSYEAFCKTGIVGCADCYRDFRAPLTKLLEKACGQAQHVGRVPGGEDSPTGLRNRMERLKRDMVAAIAREEYETAADLRDQIRALNARQEEGVPHE